MASVSSSTLLVLTGSHYSLFAIATQNLAQLSYDTVMLPGNLASNIALPGCSFAVVIRAGNKLYKSYAASAGITALFGISQSSLYGIAIPLKRTLYAAMIAGGAAGLFAGIFDLRAYSFVTPGLLSLVGYVSEFDSIWNLVFAVITCLIAFGLGFITIKELTGKIEEKADAERIDKP